MVTTKHLPALVWALALPCAIAQTLTAEMIMNMGNNSLFTRWRSYSRIISPAGWMNVGACSYTLTQI